MARPFLCPARLSSSACSVTVVQSAARLNNRTPMSLAVGRRRLLSVVLVLIFGCAATLRAAQHTRQAAALLDQADGLRARRERIPLEQSVDLYREVIGMAEREHLEGLGARAKLGSGLALNRLGLNADALPVLEAARQTFRRS